MRRWLPWIAFVIAAVALATIAVWFTARTVAGAVAAGKLEAAAGVGDLSAANPRSAALHFADASRSFEYAKSSLGPDWLASAVGRVPFAGRQYVAARTLVDIGVEGSSAGSHFARAYERVTAASASAGPAGKLGALLVSGRPDVESALASLSHIARLADTLPSDGLVPQLAEASASVKGTLREAAPFLERSGALLKLESYLLTGKHRLLMISQDGAELRPTGGFAGSFGLIDITASGVDLAAYRDVYVLPTPPGRVPPPRGAIMAGKGFTFRDANWWLDVPTSARAMLGLWKACGQGPVDGIVFIDTVAVKDILGVVGPITVPSYGETFTSGNLLKRLILLVEVKTFLTKTKESEKKGVLTALATELEKRVLGSGPAELAKSALALGAGADSKHVQFYFTDPAAEAAADSLGWSGRVEQPAGSTDLLAVCNAMNRGSKINFAMRKRASYEVSLRPDRSAETTLVLHYANNGDYPYPGTNNFRDWLRVYRAPGTVFPATRPGGGKVGTITEFGLPAEVRSFTLYRFKTRTETLRARVPEAVRAEAGSGGAGALQYRLHVVRQADLEDIPTTIDVNVPSGWRVASATARLTASRRSLPVTARGARVRLTVPLSGDLDLDVRLETR